jgi:uncharacterized protein
VGQVPAARQRQRLPWDAPGGEHEAVDTLELVPRPDRLRYELLRDGTHVGHVTYSLHGGVPVLDHTRVLPEFEGQGLGSSLAQAVLDHMNAAGRPYRVECPFLRAWIAKHPEYAVPA